MAAPNLKKELRAAELLGDLLVAALRDKDQFRRYIMTEKRGSDTQTVEYLFDKVDLKAIGEMVRTVKALEELKRSLMEQVQSGAADREIGQGLVILPMAGDLPEGKGA